MKSAVTLLVALTCLGGAASTLAPSPAAANSPRAASAPSSTADLDALSASLSPAQRGALGDVQGGSVEGILESLSGILSARQMAAFEGIVDRYSRGAPPPQVAALYLPFGCWTSSKAALLLSIVGYIGCPGNVARDASISMWEASNYSGVCLIAGDETCEDAADASFVSAVLWESLLSTCSVADTAYYSAYITYRTCGGDRDGGDPPTPTPEPPTPTPPDPKTPTPGLL